MDDRDYATRSSSQILGFLMYWTLGHWRIFLGHNTFE